MAYPIPDNILQKLSYDVYLKFNNVLPDTPDDITEDGALSSDSTAYLANQKITEIEYEMNWNYMRDVFTVGTVALGDYDFTIDSITAGSVVNFATSPTDTVKFWKGGEKVAEWQFVSPAALGTNTHSLTLIGGNHLMFSAKITEALDGAELRISGFKKFARLSSLTPDTAIEIVPYDLLVYAVACQAALVNPAWSFRYPNLVVEYQSLLRNAMARNLSIGGTTVVDHTSENRRVF